MRKIVMCVLSVCIASNMFANDAFKAKLRVQNVDGAVWTKGGTMFLPAAQEQGNGTGIVFEAENVAGLDCQFSDGALQYDGERVAIIDARFLEYRFKVTKAGKYRSWYEATYPTTFPYLHSEVMDGGEKVVVHDSKNLTPNVWRRHSGPAYDLSAGDHVWTFPSPGAWCGKTKLDKLMLLPEGVKPEDVKNLKTRVAIANAGTVSLRRIKATLLKRWQLNADLELNGGAFEAQYRYDSQDWQRLTLGDWAQVPSDSEYLYFRFCLRKGADAAISPFAKNITLMVEEK